MARNLLEMEEGESPEGPALSACPACGGVLLEMQKGNMLQFQCRVGHRYSPESLMSRHSDSVERALWVALRSLEEHGALAKRMANHWRELESNQIADHFDEKANEAEKNARVLRKALGENGKPD